jgi:hypothetical protein
LTFWWSQEPTYQTQLVKGEILLKHPWWSSSNLQADTKWMVNWANNMERIFLFPYFSLFSFQLPSCKLPLCFCLEPTVDPKIHH